MNARYFATAAAFRRWLETRHATERELLVGFYKKAAPKRGIGYKEAVDEALCFGWIDGVKKRVDEHRYTHRFTPRAAGSIWSLINTTRIRELIDQRRVASAGLAAFARRDPKRTGVYSFEQRPSVFDPALERAFKKHAAAWTFFRAQPPGYQRLMTFWVMSAKQQATRERRLAALVKRSAEGKRIQ
jgi:uncharacterized protein YdeI (YjbR/CyaY-like superfamily)